MDMNLVVIPEKLKVGYCKRDDTYSGKLGYVIYHDGKKWRKETSFESWRDKDVKPDFFDNVPTEGFVINHEVGGVHNSWSSWNPRTEKIRVYDPRGWEMELSIPNILFLLQECSSIKGKGLEGKFVYAWDKTELVLIPITCQEYIKATEYTNKLNTKFDKKLLKAGTCYVTKDGKHIDTYLGKFICWGAGFFGKETHVFVRNTDCYITASNPDYDCQCGEDPDFADKLLKFESNKRQVNWSLKTGTAVSLSVAKTDKTGYDQRVFNEILESHKYLTNKEYQAYRNGKGSVFKTFVEKAGNVFVVEISGGYKGQVLDPSLKGYTDVVIPLKIRMTKKVVIHKGEVSTESLAQEIELTSESLRSMKYGNLEAETSFAQRYQKKK